MNPGIFYTVLSASLYGSIGYYGATLLAQGFSVCDLLLWRFLVSSLMLIPFLFFALKGLRSNFKDIIHLCAAGGLFYGGSTACYFEASKTVGTGLAMVIFFTYPIFVAILSVITKKSRINFPTILSLLLIVIGSSLIAFGDGIQLNTDIRGLSLALASGFGYGLYVFTSKEKSKNLHPALSSFVVCLGNTTVFTAYALFGQKYLIIPQTSSAISDITMFALIGTVLPVFFMLQGMKTLSANKASIISVLEPVTTLAVGAFVLHEVVTGYQFLGAIIILMSAIVVQFEKDKESSDMPA